MLTKLHTIFTHEKVRRFFSFAMVGGFGAVLNTAVLYALTQFASIHYLAASAVATELAIISNFFGNNFFTFRTVNSEEPLLRKFLKFQLISVISLAGTAFILWMFVNLFGQELLLVWNAIAILTIFVANFVLNSMFTWKIPMHSTVDRIAVKIRQGVRHTFRRSAITIFILTLCMIFALVLAHSAHSELLAPDKKLKQTSDALGALSDQTADMPNTSSNVDSTSTDSGNTDTSNNPTADVVMTSDATATNESSAVTQFASRIQAGSSTYANTSNTTVVANTSAPSTQSNIIGNASNVDSINTTNIANTTNNTKTTNTKNTLIANTTSNVTTNTSTSTSNLTSGASIVTIGSASVTTTNESTSASSTNVRTTNVAIVAAANTSNTSQGNQTNQTNQTTQSNQTITAAVTNVTASNATVTNTTNTTNTTNATAGGIVAVSQLGYHPSSVKQVIFYSDATTGTFLIKNTGTNAILFTGNLTKPKNYAGTFVNCQGNMPCLAGDFTSFTTAGTYYIE
ncbi:MAG TPA: GtrA family protein, partial [Acidobacteriota bacterium]|nr:GtrA family protein [Acidobacteriota bacterium]